MEKARIFISYKRKNKVKVFSIVKKIETQLGVKCWVDLDGIESNAQFASKICSAIDMADIVLFMHSSAHLNINFEKDWTIKELNYAEAKEKRITLVKLDDAPLDNIFLMNYGTKNNIDSRDETQFQKLLKDLKVWLDLPQQAQDDIKCNEKTNTSLFTRLVNKIMGQTKKASAFEGNVSSSSNTKEETSKDSSSKVQKIYDEDGNIKYEGEVRNGLYHGQGTLYLTDGAKYEGQFADGKFHGQGTLYIDGEIQYKGQWVNNASHGKGIEYDLNGSYYEGEFEFGKPNGQGTRYFANGDKYEGEFADNNFHGEGIFYYADGGKYVGEFKEGNKHGQGTRYWPDGDKYIGQWKDDKKQGQGTYYFANLNKYEGQWKNDKRHGIGTFYWNNGKKYIGQWKNDQRHGRGIQYYTDGTQENVIFNNGKQI